MEVFRGIGRLILSIVTIYYSTLIFAKFTLEGVVPSAITIQNTIGFLLIFNFVIYQILKGIKEIQNKEITYKWMLIFTIGFWINFLFILPVLLKSSGFVFSFSAFIFYFFVVVGMYFFLYDLKRFLKPVLQNKEE